MGIRVMQVCGLWFWVAFAIFVIVLFQQSSSILPSTNTQPIPASSPKTAPTPPQEVKPLGLNTRQRMSRSEKSWKSSVNLRHEMAHAHPHHPHIPFFPAQKLEDFGKYPYTLWDFFPATYTCPHDIQRVGRLGDGGKWVCGMSLYESKPPLTTTPSKPPSTKKINTASRPETVIYSFGVNDESTFEAEMLERIPSAQIYAYDFSVQNFGPQLPPSHANRAHFKSFGLGSIDEPEKSPQFYTLQTLMKQNHHEYIDILKIDIEGSEYTALDSFMNFWDEEKRGEEKGFLPVGQVMIELHLVDDKNVGYERFNGWWERLERFGMRPVWLEINLLAVTLGQGKTDPRCVEYVWVNGRDERSVLLQE